MGEHSKESGQPEGCGQAGRSLLARDAVRKGLADCVGTLEETMVRLTGRGRRGRAALDDSESAVLELYEVTEADPETGDVHVAPVEQREAEPEPPRNTAWQDREQRERLHRIRTG